MLIPTEGTDTQVVVDALLHKWYPLFGMFKYIDSDYGPGFNSNVFRLFCQALGSTMQYEEPNHHRGIGKVERVIGFVQSILQRFNVQLDEQLTEYEHSDDAWQTIKVILPHIQAAINQRRPRFTTFSPNMLMFGSNNSDLSNIDIIANRFEELYNKSLKKGQKVHQDYIYLDRLITSY